MRLVATTKHTDTQGRAIFDVLHSIYIYVYIYIIDI